MQLRLKLHLSRERGLILTAGGQRVLRSQDSMNDVYLNYRDEDDGWLYIIYAEENMFG